MLGNVLFGNLTKQCFTLTSVPYQHGDPICSRRAAGDHQLMLDILADGGSSLGSPVNLVEVSNHEDVEVDGHVGFQHVFRSRKKSNHNNFVKKMSDVSVLVLMSPYSTPLLVFLHQDIPKHCHWHKAKCKVTHGSDLKIPKKTAPWVSSPPMSSMSTWMVYPQVSQKRPFFQSGSPKSFEPSWISKDLPKNFAKQPTWKQLFEYQCSLGQKMTVGRFMFVGLNP